MSAPLLSTVIESTLLEIVVVSDLSLMLFVLATSSALLMLGKFSWNDSELSSDVFRVCPNSLGAGFSWLLSYPKAVSWLLHSMYRNTHNALNVSHRNVLADSILVFI